MKKLTLIRSTLRRIADGIDGDGIVAVAGTLRKVVGRESGTCGASCLATCGLSCGGGTCWDSDVVK